MFKILLVVFLFINVLMIMVKDPLMFSLLVLFKSVIVASFVIFMSSSWLGYMFFLMFVGGVLVLCFYSLTLKSNPVKSLMMNTNYVMFCFLFCLVISYFSFDISSSGLIEKTKLKLWSCEELMFVGGVLVLLIITLWLVSKFVFVVNSAFRPVF